jgi:hypothetical protein
LVKIDESHDFISRAYSPARDFVLIPFAVIGREMTFLGFMLSLADVAVVTIVVSPVLIRWNLRKSFHVSIGFYDYKPPQTGK